jgi:prepilin-type N-terminal cleavage/methylation domain-containing protein
MKQFFKNQHGFTLVELMIVIVIVGILAAVAVPIYQGNVKKAKMSECDAALGTIRTALRVFYAEHGRYPVVTDAQVTALSDSLDIQAADLKGKYFSADVYKLTSNATTYTIKCDTTFFATGKERTLDQDGNFGGGL